MIRKQTLLRVRTEEKKMIFHWSDEIQSSCSFLFLRDNCNSLHTRHVNGQKLIDTIDIPDDISPLSWNLNEDKTKLTIHWNHDQHLSEYSSQWLRDHAISKTDCKDEKADPAFLWDHDLQTRLPEKDFSLIYKSEKKIINWLDFIRKFGFGILHSVPILPNYVLEVIGLFGFVRETNYGKVFDVKTVHNPNNLAFTNAGIQPHTDNPYRHPVPTVQVLHCLRSSAKGGDSILVDGFRIAEELRKNQPAHFRLLTTVPLKYRFRDKQVWLENSAPVISLDLHGHVKAIVYNNRSVCPFRLEEDRMESFYQAYRAFGQMTCDPKFQIRFKMEPGDLYMVNNERILHARSAFDNNYGERWLQGAYSDIDGLLSSLRVHE